MLDQILALFFSAKENLNPIPDISILGFSNSAENKDMMSKIWTNGDSII